MPTEAKSKTKAKTEDVPVSEEVPAHLRRVKDRVAIVGFAHTRNQAPFDDPDYEIWGINRLHVSMPDKQWDRYFQLHDIADEASRDQGHIDWLASLNCPVYLRPADIGKYEISGQVGFPKDDMVNHFGNYFTNTISWLLAFAIALEYKEIAVFGVDMAVDTLIDSEYAYQRPSCEYFLGIAAGLGITVSIPPGSDLLRATHLYGFETGGILREKYESRLQELGLRKQEMQNNLAQLDHQRAMQIASINQLDGAQQDVQYWLKNWASSPAVRDSTIGLSTEE